jgi:hypothetical protein
LTAAVVVAGTARRRRPLSLLFTKEPLLWYGNLQKPPLYGSRSMAGSGLFTWWPRTFIPSDAVADAAVVSMGLAA